jgi:hypothetical protein
MNAISSIDACIASVCSGLQLSLNDVVFAADLWNLTLDSTATHDWLMGLGTPPYFLAQLVWGSVFLEYLSHTYLIPSGLTKTIGPHTNDTFVNHRTNRILINTSRN